MAILKVPRHHAPVVQAAFTMLSSVNDIPLAATLLSNNGSARTCKISVLTELKREFYIKMRMRNNNDDDDDNIRKNLDAQGDNSDEVEALKEKLQLKSLKRLEVQMAEIRNMDL